MIQPDVSCYTDFDRAVFTEKEPFVTVDGQRHSLILHQINPLVLCTFETSVEVAGKTFRYGAEKYLTSNQRTKVMSLNDSLTTKDSTWFYYLIDHLGGIFLGVVNKEKNQQKDKIYSLKGFREKFLKEKNITVSTTIIEEPTYGLEHQAHVGRIPHGEKSALLLTELSDRRPTVISVANSFLSRKRIDYPYKLYLYSVTDSEIAFDVATKSIPLKKEEEPICINTINLNKACYIQATSDPIGYMPSKDGNIPVWLVLTIERLNGSPFQINF